MDKILYTVHPEKSRHAPVNSNGKSSILDGIFQPGVLPSGKRSHSWLEYHHFSIGHTSSTGPFSIAMLVHRSVAYRNVTMYIMGKTIKLNSCSVATMWESELVSVSCPLRTGGTVAIRIGFLMIQVMKKIRLNQLIWRTYHIFHRVFMGVTGRNRWLDL